METEAAGLEVFTENMRAMADAEKITAPPPERATKNRVLLDMDTMLLGDLSPNPETDAPRF